MARPPLRLGELIEHWTLVGQETDLVSAKHLDTRLPFALLLKFYGRHGRFPRSRGELHPDAVEFVARALKADPASVAAYDWSGRSIERHHGQIRRHFGFRVCGEAEGEKLAMYLAGDFAQRERRYDLVREQFLGECRVRQLEPPTPDQVDRYVRTALFQGARLLSGRVAGRLSGQAVARLLALIGAGTSDDVEDEDPDLLRMIKAAPGPVSLASLLAEAGKLTAIGSFGLPEDLFRDVAPRVLKEWRDQAMTESPRHLRDHADDLKVALLAALLFCRRREITDDLVNLLISTVHRIGARAERRVTTELVNAFRRVQGKEGLLFRVADAALARPDDSVRRVVFPAAGEDNLRNLVAEYKSSGPAYRRTVQTTYRASYTNHYRAGLIRLLEVLQFRSEDSHQPVLEAVQLVRRHAASPQLTYYPEGETVPVHGGLAGDWADLVYRTDGKGRRRVVRSVYEIRTFEALVDQLRCKGIWVLGAEEFRNPDEDLVTDFAERRTEHYAALRKPLDPRDFITELQGELRRELQALDDAVPGLPWLEIAPHGRHGAIRLTPLDAAPEPANLRRLKKAIAHRWGMLRLIDVLKEAVLRSGCQQVIGRAAGRGGRLGPGELLERLLLVIYAYGTGAVAAADRGADDRGPDEHDLYYARRWYLTTELTEALAVQIANATFAARHKAVWGEGSSAVASDSTHFGAWDQNLFTEWHSRYEGRGVLIYWHIERKSMVIHSQLLSCTASEVAAMIQGAIHHGTEMDVKANYVDTHGQSVVGFGLTRLLGFDLLPRIKRINHIRLYPPARGEEFPNLVPAMVGRAIDWDLIAAQYDDVIKHATSIKSNAASTAAILRRFGRTNVMHPAYQAMQEIGRAQRTIFVCRYLRDRELQREINAALNVAESWNAGNAVLHYGKGGDIPGNRRDEQELTVLCLRVLQASVSFLNTLLIQDVLDGGELQLAAEDQRAITPLFWSHIAPYGEVTLDMTRRISLNGDAIPDGEQAGT